MFKSLFIASLLLSSVSVFSQEVDPNLEIASVEITEIQNDKNMVELPGLVGNPIDDVIMYLDGIIAIGKKIWPIVEAGKPVVTTSGLIPSVSVLPKIEGEAASVELRKMANWSAPRVASYRVSYKNRFDSEVIGFVFSVYFQHSGTYQGKGKYITSLKVQASEVSVAWGFDFDAASQLINVANVGTDENPVASAIMQITYTAKSMISEIKSAQSFYVDGKGTLKLLNN